MPKSKMERKQPSGPYPGKKIGSVSDAKGTKSSGQVENSENFVMRVPSSACTELGVY